MNTKEALTRVKTGYFSGDYGFDWQLLVDSVGIIGEMFRSGQIHEVVQCKDCRFRQSRNVRAKNGEACYLCEMIKDYKPLNWFCADGERR